MICYEKSLVVTDNIEQVCFLTNQSVIDKSVKYQLILYKFILVALVGCSHLMILCLRLSPTATDLIGDRTVGDNRWE